jgi:hypothetical protein
MTKLTVSNINSAGAAKGALVVALAVGALALAGCEQHPYPTPAADETASQPPPPSQLMGAPNTPDGQPAMGPAGPDGPSPSGYSGPPGGPTPYPQEAPLRAPCPPSALPQGPDAPTVVICSAPVPNPVEDEASPRHPRHHFHGDLAPGYDQDYGPAPRGYVAYPHHHRHYWEHAPVAHARAYVHTHTSGYVFHNGHRYRIVRPAPPAGRHPMVAPHHIHQSPRAATAIAPAPIHPVQSAHPTISKPVLPVVKPKPVPHIKPKPARTEVTTSNTASNTTASNTTESNTTGNTTAVAGTPAERYAALQSALATVIAREATLNVPSHFEPGEAADVTLNVPSDFAQTLRQEAAKQDLGDQTASVNLTSALIGEGYSVTPAEPQSQPLTLGEQTVFHWKVTAAPNAKGPLQASVNADILSDGQSLPLGPVKVAGAEHWTGRVVGVGLLVLIALILLAWAAQRKRPTAGGASKPRENHTNGV